MHKKINLQHFNSITGTQQYIDWGNCLIDDTGLLIRHNCITLQQFTTQVTNKAIAFWM